LRQSCAKIHTCARLHTHTDTHTHTQRPEYWSQKRQLLQASGRINMYCGNEYASDNRRTVGNGVFSAVHAEAILRGPSGKVGESGLGGHDLRLS
jgi:hypothetical protein